MLPKRCDLTAQLRLARLQVHARLVVHTIIVYLLHLCWLPEWWVTVL